MAGDHLFLSSADRDWALAEWLALRLTAEGYRIWSRRFPLLGGERYPRNPERAITVDTFRLLALLSRASLSSPDAIRSLEQAIGIGRERQVEFLILLEAEDWAAGDMPPLLHDLARIPFSRSWGAGLAELLAKLRAIEAPRPLLDGARIAREAREYMIARRSWHTVL